MSRLGDAKASGLRVRILTPCFHLRGRQAAAVERVSAAGQAAGKVPPGAAIAVKDAEVVPARPAAFVPAVKHTDRLSGRGIESAPLKDGNGIWLGQEQRRTQDDIGSGHRLTVRGFVCGVMGGARGGALMPRSKQHLQLLRSWPQAASSVLKLRAAGPKRSSGTAI